jgi:hypothetical protein
MTGLVLWSSPPWTDTRTSSSSAVIIDSFGENQIPQADREASFTFHQLTLGAL